MTRSPYVVDAYGIRERRPSDPPEPPAPTAEDRAKAERFFDESFANASPEWKALHRDSIVNSETRFNAFIRRDKERRAAKHVAACARAIDEMGQDVKRRRAA